MNFLHYAIFMFAICSAVLIVVSLGTAAPEAKKLAGLTFFTVTEKLDVVAVGDTAAQPALRPSAETVVQHRVNVALSLLLALSVIALWIYFR